MRARLEVMGTGIETNVHVVEECAAEALEAHFRPWPRKRVRAGWGHFYRVWRAVEAYCNRDLAAQEDRSERMRLEMAAFGAFYPDPAPANDTKREAM